MQKSKTNFIVRLKKNWLFIVISSFIFFFISLIFLLNLNLVNYQVNIPIKINFEKSILNGINLSLNKNIEYYIQETQDLSNSTINELFKNQSTKSIYSYNTSKRVFNIKITSLKNISDENIKEYIVTLNKKIDSKNDFYIKNYIENSAILSQNYKNSSNLSEAIFKSESKLFTDYVKNLRTKNSQLQLYKNNVVLNIFELDHDINHTYSNHLIKKDINLSATIKKELNLHFLKELNINARSDMILENSSISYHNTINELIKIQKITEILEQFYIPNLSIIDNFNETKNWSYSQIDLKFSLIPIIFFLSVSISFILVFIKELLALKK